MSHHGLHKPRHFHGLSPLGLCLTIIDGSFTLRGIYHNLLIPIAYCLLLFSYSVQLIWTLSHYPSLPNPTLNAVLINKRVPTTHHRTPNTVSISTMYSYPCHAMFKYICNAIMPLQFLMLHVLCTLHESFSSVVLHINYHANIYRNHMSTHQSMTKQFMSYNLP